MTEPDVRLEGRQFAQVPEALIFDPEVSPGAKAIYMVLLRHGTDPGRCFPSHDRIAGYVGLSPRSIPRLVIELEEAGWVRRVIRTGTSNGYVVRTDEPRAQERAPQETPRTTARPPAQESAPPPRTGARLKRATEREQPNETPQPPTAEGGGRLALVGQAEAEDPLRGFPEFWQEYPMRNGKRLERRKAEEQWRKLTLPERFDAYRGAQHYRAACDAELHRAKDAFRWLRDRAWEEWQTPPVTTPRSKTADPLRGRHETSLDDLMKQAIGGSR